MRTLLFGLLFGMGTFYNFAHAQAPHSNAQSVSNSSFSDSTAASQEQKSPTGAMLRSLALPGWGQWYNNQKIKAGLVVLAQGVLIGYRFYYDKKAEEAAAGSTARDLYLDRRNLTYWLMAGVVLLSMVDAYIDAHLYNFDTGPDLALRLGVIQSNQRHPNSAGVGVAFRASF